MRTGSRDLWDAIVNSDSIFRGFLPGEMPEMRLDI